MLFFLYTNIHFNQNFFYERFIQVEIKLIDNDNLPLIGIFR
jgi:hypothetical protein